MGYQRTSKGRNGERGVTLYIVAGSLVILLGIGALAVDLASLYVAHNEAQRAADAAALAGAKVFVESGCVTIGNCSGEEGVATDRANQVAGQILIGGQPGTATVTFNEVAQDPQITVQIQSANLAVYFAPAIGFTNSNSVTSSATAEAWNPSGQGGPGYCTGCTRPWLIANCDQTIAGVSLCAGEATLLNPGSTGVTNANCTPGGVVGEQIVIPLQTPTNPGLTPPTTLYGALDVDSPGTGNLGDYRQAITTCFTGQTTCGEPTLNILPVNAALSTSTQAGVENLLHVAATGLGLGQDYIDTTVCPPQIHAGAMNPLVTAGVVAQDSVISISDSIVTAYVFDAPPGVGTYTGLAYNPVAGDTSQLVNIVGFAQIFVTQVDATGNVWGNILGVAGCGANNGGGCGAGTIQGPTTLPVRLIQSGN